MAAEENEAPTHITIKVQDSHSAETAFKIKRKTLFSKVMSAYAKQTEQDISSFRFTFNGVNVGKDDTPESLDMEEDDIVEAHVAQQGGRGRDL